MNVPIRSDSFRSVSKFFLFVCRSDHSPRLSFQSSLRAASSKTTSQLYRALHRMVPGSVKRVLWQITKNTKYHIVTSKHITTCCVRIQSNAASCYIERPLLYPLRTSWPRSHAYLTDIDLQTGQHIALHCNTVHCCPFQSNALHLQCTTWKIKRVHI